MVEAFTGAGHMFSCRGLSQHCSRCGLHSGQTSSECTSSPSPDWASFGCQTPTQCFMVRGLQRHVIGMYVERAVRCVYYIFCRALFSFLFSACFQFLGSSKSCGEARVGDYVITKETPLAEILPQSVEETSTIRTHGMGHVTEGHTGLSQLFF